MAVFYRADQFPPDNLDWSRLLPLLGPASAAIARYEGLLRAVPNPDVLLGPLTHNEAVLSTRIEGIQATLGEVLESEAEGNLSDESTPEKADIHEVLNYLAALREGSRRLDEWPISQRLLLHLHRILMRGVRGRNRAPGEFRVIPNWIGREGCTLEEARFVPCHAGQLPAAMSAWEKYVNAESPDTLVQLAVVHAEFEAIHPFLDGNGRLGRLIMPLFLKSKGLLSRPNFYLSGYFEQRRDEYYDRLLAVSRDGDWTGWCVFFLKAVIAQAAENQSKAEKIIALYQERKDWIATTTRSQYAVRALDCFFERPIFRTSDFVRTAAIPKPTAMRILRVVRDNGLLRELRPGGGRRAAILMFPELLNIAEGHDVV